MRANSSRDLNRNGRLDPYEDAPALPLPGRPKVYSESPLFPFGLGYSAAMRGD